MPARQVTTLAGAAAAREGALEVSGKAALQGFAAGKCPQEFLVAFSCKRRGVFPFCGAKRAAEIASRSHVGHLRARDDV
jgi:hypothetical protein